jgi:hypothetical protein
MRSTIYRQAERMLERADERLARAPIVGQPIERIMTPEGTMGWLISRALCESANGSWGSRTSGLGNAQVPGVAAFAWRTLMQRAGYDPEHDL